MRKKLLSALQYLIFLGLGIFLIWWQLKGMTTADKDDFLHSLKNANYWLVPIIVVLALLSHLSRCMRWKILLEPIGYNPGLANMFCATMVGYLANSAVPRLGEILKCTFLSRYEKIPVDKLIGTIVIERVFDLVCFLVFIGLTVAVEWTAVSDFMNNDIDKMGGGFSWKKPLIIIGSILLFILLLVWIFRRFRENGFVQKVRSFLSGIKDGLLTIRHLKHKKKFILHTLFIWSMYLSQIYVGFSAMSQTAGLGIGAACAVLTLATFAMIITPGGIGAFPAAIMLVLSIYKIPAIYGQSFGWLMWGVSTGIIVIVGFSCLLILPYINKKRIETA